jgi:CO/xanthine dehydrogenase Mo-binding subunit
MAGKYVGQRVKRTEDPRLIKGLAHYVDDIKLPDTLYVMFLRSIYAHARLRSVDTSAAAKAPGVVAVYTGKEVSNWPGSLRQCPTRIESARSSRTRHRQGVFRRPSDRRRGGD